MTTPTRPQPVDAQALRRALGLFATGVTIVTTRDRSEEHTSELQSH